MTNATAPVAAAITRAQEQLQTALAALAALLVVETATLAMTRHALHNYLALTGMTLEVVLRDLGTATDPSILTWLHALQHVTDLMTHTVRRLGAPSTLEPEHLEFERVDLALGVARVCQFVVSANLLHGFEQFNLQINVRNAFPLPCRSGYVLIPPLLCYVNSAVEGGI